MVSEIAIVATVSRSHGIRGLGTTVDVGLLAPVPVEHVIRRLDGAGPVLVQRPGAVAVPAWRLAVSAVATFILVATASLTAFAAVPMLVGHESVVVASGSMAPAFLRSDVVVTHRADRPLPVGAVIDFQLPGGQRQIHRIVAVVDGGYRTKGDGNEAPDSQVVAAENVRGFGMLVVPIVGQLPLWADAGQWITLGSVVAALTCVAWFSSPDSMLGSRAEPSGGRRGRR